MVDRVLIMNLRRRTDRWWFALGALGALQFPLSDDYSWDNLIVRFMAHDGKDYPDDHAVREAAIADGFPHFQNYRRAGRFITAWDWTWISAIRAIAESDKITLMSIDDYVPVPGWTFQRIKRIAAECYDESAEYGGFCGLQLRQNIRGKNKIEIKPHTSVLQKGFVPNDQALILSPEGASILLDFFKSTPPYGPPDRILKKFAWDLIDNENLSGRFWHVIDPVYKLGYHHWQSDLKDDWEKITG